MLAFLDGGLEYSVPPPPECSVLTPPAGVDCSGMATLTTLEAGLFLGVLTVVAMVLAVQSFRARDVP